MAGARGLGRGLDVLLKGMSVERDSHEVLMLKLEDVRPNPRQPRLEFSREALDDLASSIKEQGVIQPILVRNAPDGSLHGYELVAGERRLRASKLAGLREIPAIVREVTDEQSLALALIENLQRENLNALEEAKGMDQLLHTFGLSQEALAMRVGKSRSAVANSLRLLHLSPEIQESLSSEAISAGHARALLAVADEGARLELWRRIIASGLSVRDAEAQAGYFKEHGALPAQDGAAQPSAGPGRRKVVLPQELSSLQKELRQRFGLKVSVGGDPDRGKVTFSYGSAQELRALLSQWGVTDAAD